MLRTEIRKFYVAIVNPMNPPPLDIPTPTPTSAEGKMSSLSLKESTNGNKYIANEAKQCNSFEKLQLYMARG